MKIIHSRFNLRGVNISRCSHVCSGIHVISVENVSEAIDHSGITGRPVSRRQVRHSNLILMPIKYLLSDKSDQDLSRFRGLMYLLTSRQKAVNFQRIQKFKP